jgi:hypothetical protein
LYQVTGEDIYIRHTNVTKEGTIHVAVMDEDNEKVMMSIVLPEFTLLYNRLNQYDCYVHLNLIITRYDSIVNNLKDEKGIKKFLRRGENFMEHKGLTSLDSYMRLIKAKANRIIRSYEEVKVNPLRKMVRSALRKIFKEELSKDIKKVDKSSKESLNKDSTL